MIITRTPLRISFFGGGTDYPSWYRVHGGAVLATTIDKYAYLACRYLPPFFEHRFSVTYSRIEHCQTIDEIQHPAVREVLRYLNIERGVQIRYDGDLPARTGVGSSSAFTVGLLNAFRALKGEMPSREALARDAIHIEQNILKEAVGSQDQILAAFGGFNLITFHPSGEISVRPVTISTSRIRELQDHLMLFFSGIQRTASTIAASFVPTLLKKEDELRLLRGMVDESVSILTGSGSLTGFGALLHRTWQAKRRLSAVVSNPHVEGIYERALAAGAIGGKLIGAGGGGFLLFFVSPERQAAVRLELRELLHVPFQFDATGSQIIFFGQEAEYAEEHERRLNHSIERFRELHASELRAA